MVKVRFSGGWDNDTNRYIEETGTIIAYLLNEVVEVETSRGKIVRLYKSEYSII